jgi:putative phosphoesterase
MRYGIIADIHGNLEAFEAVLSKLKGKADQVLCAGDVVGYGPNPNECVEMIRGENIPAVAGNHDKALVNEFPLGLFIEAAAEAMRWTQSVITPENLELIKGLPLKLEYPGFDIVHGSLLEPLSEYLTSMAAAVPTFNLMSKPKLFVGHTHQPLHLKYQDKEILNPGSVGQPRDGDPAAAYLLYDDEKQEVQLFRVEYDIEAVQKKMKAVGLPERLISRLKAGR